MTRNLPRSSGTPYERETVSAFAATNSNGDVVIEAVFGNVFSENHVPLTLDAARVLRNKLDAAIHEGRKAEQSLTADERVIADREERDYCQAGTQGCCIDHDRDHGSCETW